MIYLPIHSTISKCQLHPGTLTWKLKITYIIESRKIIRAKPPILWGASVFPVNFPHRVVLSIHWSVKRIPTSSHGPSFEVEGLHQGSHDGSLSKGSSQDGESSRLHRRTYGCGIRKTTVRGGRRRVFDDVFFWRRKTRWWFSKFFYDFLMFTPILTSIFFRWAATKTTHVLSSKGVNVRWLRES